MQILKREMKKCPCCGENHEVLTILDDEYTIFKGIDIHYQAEYEYCEDTDMINETEDMISRNDIVIKDIYRLKKGLLTSSDIKAIRQKYAITQVDLSILLNLGKRTITRYESHQVQDVAYDLLLRKLDKDPEWFLSLLKQHRDDFSSSMYEKYEKNAKYLYKNSKDYFIRQAINTIYVNLSFEDCGGILNLDKVVDVIKYFSNAGVRVLYKVKLMKMLWYADALFYKRYSRSITGLAYTALPMGAVPVGYNHIIDLKGVKYSEKDIGNGTAFEFLPTDKNYNLTSDEIEILDNVISVFKNCSKDEIVNKMHREKAYIETQPYEIISYSYAKDLSI